jgi:hypothetical protein
MYQLALWTTKLAVYAFCRRVFQDRWSKIFVWSMMGIISAFELPLILAAIFQCKPIGGETFYKIFFYNSSHPIGAWSAIPSKCMSNVPSLYASVILNISADVALLGFVLPKIGEHLSLMEHTF